MYNFGDRPITIKFENGWIRLPLYTIMASIAKHFSTKEIVTYKTPFGEITFKT